MRLMHPNFVIPTMRPFTLHDQLDHFFDLAYSFQLFTIIAISVQIRADLSAVYDRAKRRTTPVRQRDRTSSDVRAGRRPEHES